MAAPRIFVTWPTEPDARAILERVGVWVAAAGYNEPRLHPGLLVNPQTWQAS